MEDTSVFALSGFQYIIMAVVVTKGYPHKKPLYYNGESSVMSKQEGLGGWKGVRSEQWQKKLDNQI